MIVTLDAERVGYLDSEHVVAVAGNDVFSDVGRGTLHTSLEIYFRAATATEPALTFLQQRAPVLRGFNGAFAREVFDFVQTYGFSDVLLLLSADATRRIDSQIVGSQLRYLDGAEGAGEAEHSSSKMDTSSSHSSSTLNALKGELKRLEVETEEVVIKRGTVSWHLRQLFGSEKSAPLTTLIHFVHEGYNFPEGLAVASALAHGLKLSVPLVPVRAQGEEIDPSSPSPLPRFNWVLPASWRHVIRSPVPDPRIFG